MNLGSLAMFVVGLLTFLAFDWLIDGLDDGYFAHAMIWGAFLGLLRAIEQQPFGARHSQEHRKGSE